MQAADQVASVFIKIKETHEILLFCFDDGLRLGFGAGV